MLDQLAIVPGNAETDTSSALLALQRLRRRVFMYCLGWLGLPGGNGVFVVKSRGELRELVGVDVHGQGVVLRLESRVLSGLICPSIALS